MYAVGHLALGYLAGKATSKAVGVDVKVPLLFLFAILPDIDLLIPYLQHRGPAHSVIVFVLFFLPAFLVLKKKATPCFVALAQHSLVGDWLTGEGVQLFWPLIPEWVGLGANSMLMMSFANIFFEWILFGASMIVLLQTKDVKLLLEPHASGLILLVPVITVLLPTLLSLPLYVPLGLAIPHIVYLTLFSLSITTDFRAIGAKMRARLHKSRTLIH